MKRKNRTKVSPQDGMSIGECQFSHKKQYISKDAARAAVLSHAGIAADTIRNYSCELDNDDGRAIYEIEFESGKFSYEYEIDAATGAVINSDKEMED